MVIHSLLERALMLAARAHTGQKDKAGQPYILHPLRVMIRVKTEEQMIVALLHDVIEDSDFTLKDLLDEKFPAPILKAIKLLTHDKDISYDDYLKRLRPNPIARAVKLADLEDNMDIRRLDELTDRDVARLRRYQKAWKQLAR
ncbi:MAG: GTP pyrophosphokinase [Candidatus Sumerlaeota bacterium]|nr:GTP pyrophosphokinase [Candidatus Sumerlaeota bacterium]